MHGVIDFATTRTRARPSHALTTFDRPCILSRWMNDRLSHFVAREYDRLRRLAQGIMRGERTDHTLTPTAVVHEALLRMHDEGVPPADTAQFGAFASTTIRRVLVAHARRRSREKRGGDRERVAQDLAELPDELPVADILAIDEALSDLEGFDAEKARVVELRFFAGLSVEEVAALLATSESTVARQWRAARAFLHSRLGDVSS